MIKMLFVLATLVCATFSHAETEWQFGLPTNRIVCTPTYNFLLLSDITLYPSCTQTSDGWGGQGPVGVIQIPTKDMLSLLLTSKTMGQKLRFAVVTLKAGTFPAPGMGSTTCQLRYAETSLE